jgi:class 3 adenylate cyclase/tetratricopeptide (TPR) repeat protein
MRPRRRCPQAGLPRVAGPVRVPDTGVQFRWLAVRGVGMSGTGVCPRCVSTTADGARFCSNCGGPLAPAATVEPATDTGERRRLTILFCDLVGSTALSEELDPEELGDAVLSYQEMGRSVVREFGGHIAQYLGDGLLAYFGYPVAHEDDAERAVLAGMAILQGIADVNRRCFPDGTTVLEARVGIHAGPAVVGAMGSADRSDTSAFGSTPNIAARLESFASPGTVVISDDVRTRLDDRFETVDLGSPELRGISRPIRVWEVRGVGERVPILAGAPSTPMIGREVELARLLEVTATANEGRPGHVLVTAEPGVGKSRLLRELYDRLQRSGEGALWLEGQCAELSSASPLAPVLTSLRRGLGLLEAQDPAERRELLTRALSVLGTGAHQAAWCIGDLLSVDVPPPPGAEVLGAEARRKLVLGHLSAWVRALSRKQLVIVAVEDLHWADPTTLELLDLLAATESGHRLVSLHTTRPGRDLPRPDERFEQLTIEALSTDESDRLARQLAAARSLPESVVSAVAHRGDGVPLFIEELVQAAAERPVTAVPEEIPTSLQDLLTARLDALGEARSVAQAAAVLGREFTLRLLEMITERPRDDLDRALEALIDAGLVTHRRTPTGVAYLFRHALIQDAAYESLLRRRRRALHAAAADALAANYGTNGGESPEVIGFHLARADRFLEAGLWYERAGHRAAERAALHEAGSHFAAGIEAVERAEPSPARQQRLLSLNVLLANILMGEVGVGNEKALPVWHRAIQLAEEIGDDLALTAALNGLAMFRFDRGEQGETEELARRILDIGERAERSEARVCRLRGHGTLGLVRLYQGRGDEALDHIEVALSLAREGDFFSVTFGLGHDQETFFHMVRSWALWWAGHPDASLLTARTGLDVATSIPSSLSQAMARHALALAHHLRGEAPQSARVAEENLTFCRAIGIPFWAGTAELLLGTQRARLGDPAGVDMAADGARRLSDIGGLTGGSFGMAMLAEASIHAGSYEDAVGYADLGLATGDMVDQHFCDVELLAFKGRALAAIGQVEDAVAALAQSIEVGTRMGAASATLQAALALASVLDRSDPVRAHAVLTTALDGMKDGADTADQRAARAALRELSVAK